MKNLIIVCLMIGLIVLGFICITNQNFNKVYNKLIKSECEFKQLEDGWTQIENCAIYKVKGVKK